MHGPAGERAAGAAGALCKRPARPGKPNATVTIPIRPPRAPRPHDNESRRDDDLRSKGYIVRVRQNRKLILNSINHGRQIYNDIAHYLSQGRVSVALEKTRAESRAGEQDGRCAGRRPSTAARPPPLHYDRLLSPRGPDAPAPCPPTFDNRPIYPF
ncbi:hypothetical protein EVAR_18734_1 [Eumeta japonica]|uniref:Uncharacterized protein n=1 Tax=Eumeta variegata TaxID=151549 RepID=A0A4C1UM68_EUMVA|nr:hypothetical protein EVAR_18734_1 [Eumeta japonica]